MSQKLNFQYFKELAAKRNHKVLTMDEYKNIHSKIVFSCDACGSHFETTGHSYKNAKQIGCPKCKKLITSATHKNKVTSNETKKLIGLKASQRVDSLLGITGKNHPAWKGGYSRDLKFPSTQNYLWKNTLKKVYHYKCVLTGTTLNFVCHHLNSWNAYPEQRFKISNGVLIARNIHSDFHSIYKFGNNTEEQFQEFCQYKYNIDWFTFKKKYFKEFQENNTIW